MTPAEKVDVEDSAESPLCAICDYPKAMTHHESGSAKGYHPYSPRQDRRPPGMTELDNQMVEALKRQASKSRDSMRVDRRDWTPAQWCDDAKRLMHEEDGAITSLVNGHATYLISERDRLCDEVIALQEVVGAARTFVESAGTSMGTGRQHFSKRAERDLRLILAKLDGRGE